MTITAMMIDSREPEWVQNLTFGGIPTMVTLLDHGDLLASCDDGQVLSIERKTPDDLLGSLRDDRLFVQVNGMRRANSWCYLLISDELQRGPNGKVVTARGITGWDWRALEGALLTVQELGVQVVHCAGDTDLEDAVLRLGERSREPVPVWPNRPGRVLRASEQLLATLPGIGMERAQKLIDKFGNAGDALAWLTDLDQRGPEVAGIGDVTRRSVKRSLNLDDHEYICVLSAKPELMARGANG